MPDELDPTTPETPAPTPAPAPAPAPTPAASEDTTGLKNTNAALREELKALRSQNQQTLTELNNLRQTNQTLTSQIQTSQLDAATSQALAGVLPQYRPLVEANLRSQLQVTDSGVVGADGRTVDQIVGDLRSTYSNLFAADVVPSGAGVTPSTPTAPPSSTVVSAPKGIIQGVDPQDIIDGKVQIQ